MKVLLNVLAILTIVIFTGCAGTGAPTATTTPVVAPKHGSSWATTTDPCQPYKADSLMDWAKDTPGAQQKKHERRAQVGVRSDGVIECASAESASSSMSVTGTPKVAQ